MPPPLCSLADQITATPGHPSLQPELHRDLNCIGTRPEMYQPAAATYIHPASSGFPSHTLCFSCYSRCPFWRCDAACLCFWCMYVIPALASNGMPQQYSSNMVGYRWGVVETAELVGSSSVLDSQAWQDIMPHRQPGGLSRPPSILETGGTCKAFATAIACT